MSLTSPFAPSGATELRHGYTLDDLRRLAGRVVCSAWGRLGSQVERLEFAWSAIAEALYASDGMPSQRDLFNAGLRAMRRYDADNRHHLGVATSGTHTGFGSAPRFQAYWCLARTAPSPEDGVVERVALAQIWPRLTEGHRRALLALAAFDDYAEAAAALGLTYSAFRQAVGAARLRFLALWHEGETPSRVWGRDRRIGRRDAGPPAERRPVTVRMRKAGRRRRWPPGPPTFSHGLAGYNQQGCRCELCVAARQEARRRKSQRQRERRRGARA